LWGDARYPVDLSLGEDMANVVNVCASANRAVYIPEADYFYRLRKKSLLHRTVTRERFYEDLRGSEIMRKQLIERAPEKTGEINKLKFYYDISCYINYIRSAKRTDEATKRKGSLLYRHARDILEFEHIAKGFFGNGDSQSEHSGTENENRQPNEKVV